MLQWKVFGNDLTQTGTRTLCENVLTGSNDSICSRKYNGRHDSLNYKACTISTLALTSVSKQDPLVCFKFLFFALLNNKQDVNWTVGFKSCHIQWLSMKANKRILMKYLI